MKTTTGIKVARCVREYANHVKGVYKNLIKEYGDNPDYPDFPKTWLEDKIRRIDRYVNYYERGMLSVDDAMDGIVDVRRRYEEVAGK